MATRNETVNSQLGCTYPADLLAERLTSRPLAVAPRALETLLAASRVAVVPQSSGTTRGRGYPVTDAGIAVVPVLGPLVARGDWLPDQFGTAAFVPERAVSLTGGPEYARSP